MSGADAAAAGRSGSLGAEILRIANAAAQEHRDQASHLRELCRAHAQGVPTTVATDRLGGAA